MPEILKIAVPLIFVWATVWFLVGVALRRNDVADVAWGLGFVLLAGLFWFRGPVGPREMLLYGLVIAWGVRLALHIAIRAKGKREDFRYRQWREEWGRSFHIRSWLQVYLLQGGLLLLIAAPILRAAAVAPSPEPLGLLDLLGAFVWAVGFFFEAVGDEQLRRFKRGGANRGRVMTTGLWRFTRHPNYFGEVTLWWGVFLVALSLPGGGWTVVSPITVTVLLLFVSGIPMLEARYEGDPEFEEYRRRTSAFFPLPPRRLPGS